MNNFFVLNFEGVKRQIVDNHVVIHYNSRG